MADATVAREDLRQDGVLTAYKMNNVKLLKGTLVALDTDGYVKKAADTASEKFVGVAFETVDNSAGSDGDKTIRVWQTGTFEFAFNGTASQADVGKAVYASDNQTVALAATLTNDVAVGFITEFVSASKVRVAITPHAVS